MSFDDSRYYSHDAYPAIPARLGRLPSVTTITGCYPKPWMYAWMKKLGSEEAAKVKDASLEIGERVHALVHQHALGKPVDTSQDPQAVKWAFDAYLKWVNEHRVKVTDTEHVVFHAEHRYAGRLDLVAYVDDQPALIDVKTSKDLYAEQVIQVASYAEAYEESRPQLFGARYQPLRRLIVLRLGKTDAVVEPYDVTPYWAAAFEEFLRLKGTWEFDQRWRRKDAALKQPRLPHLSILPWSVAPVGNPITHLTQA